MSDLELLLADGVIDEVLQRVKTGKEAEVFLVRAKEEILAAKVYKERHQRNFRNNAAYVEGRTVRNSRTQRAMDKGSRFGQKASDEAWKASESDALHKLHAAGVRVPKPHLFYEGVLLMEVVVDPQGHVAPRLVDAHIAREDAEQMYTLLRGEVVKMLCADLVHGDLSEFNVLLAWDGPTIIDFPQVVAAAQNSQAEIFLRRDLGNLRRFFGSLDPRILARESDADEVWRAYHRRELTPDFVPTGRAVVERDRQDRGGQRGRRGPPVEVRGQGGFKPNGTRQPTVERRPMRDGAPGNDNGAAAGSTDARGNESRGGERFSRPNDGGSLGRGDGGLRGEGGGGRRGPGGGGSRDFDRTGGQRGPGRDGARSGNSRDAGSAARGAQGGRDQRGPDSASRGTSGGQRGPGGLNRDGRQGGLVGGPRSAEPGPGEGQRGPGGPTDLEEAGLRGGGGSRSFDGDARQQNPSAGAAGHDGGGRQRGSGEAPRGPDGGNRQLGPGRDTRGPDGGGGQRGPGSGARGTEGGEGQRGPGGGEQRGLAGNARGPGGNPNRSNENRQRNFGGGAPTGGAQRDFGQRNTGSGGGPASPRSGPPQHRRRPKRRF